MCLPLPGWSSPSRLACPPTMANASICSRCRPGKSTLCRGRTCTGNPDAWIRNWFRFCILLRRSICRGFSVWQQLVCFPVAVDGGSRFSNGRGQLPFLSGANCPGGWKFVCFCRLQLETNSLYPVFAFVFGGLSGFFIFHGFEFVMLASFPIVGAYSRTDAVLFSAVTLVFLDVLVYSK